MKFLSKVLSNLVNGPYRKLGGCVVSVLSCPRGLPLPMLDEIIFKAQEVWFRCNQSLRFLQVGKKVGGQV